jgi:hypothetical protein
MNTSGLLVPDANYSTEDSIQRNIPSMVNSSSGVFNQPRKSLFFEMNLILTETDSEEIILNSNEIRTKTIQLEETDFYPDIVERVLSTFNLPDSGIQWWIKSKQHLVKCKALNSLFFC